MHAANNSSGLHARPESLHNFWQDGGATCHKASLCMKRAWIEARAHKLSHPHALPRRMSVSISSTFRENEFGIYEVGP